MAGRWMFGRGLTWEEFEFKLEGVKELLKRSGHQIQNAHVKLNAVGDVGQLDLICTPADQNWLSEGNEASGGVDLNRICTQARGLEEIWPWTGRHERLNHASTGSRKQKNEEPHSFEMEGESGTRENLQREGNLRR
ncbi:hypothetical protein C8R44DRAFT_732008 [Mycena epipterygia]|nr:hypothetical protein C8R44DRAFT_732008 [Mycena epipterygia]